MRFRHCEVHQKVATCECNATPVDDVRDAWKAYIKERDWSHFITVTYRKPRRLRSDGGDLDWVLRAIRRSSGIGRVFLAGEAHKLGDLHVHGLFEAPPGADHSGIAGRMWRELFRQFGRSQVCRVRSRKAVSDYCAKYVVKEMASYLVD